MPLAYLKFVRLDYRLSEGQVNPFSFTAIFVFKNLIANRHVPCSREGN